MGTKEIQTLVQNVYFTVAEKTAVEAGHPVTPTHGQQNVFLKSDIRELLLKKPSMISTRDNLNVPVLIGTQSEVHPTHLAAFCPLLKKSEKLSLC